MAANENRNLVESLGEEYLQKKNAGLAPEIDEFARRFPELETEIRDFLQALSIIEECKSGRKG